MSKRIISGLLSIMLILQCAVMPVHAEGNAVAETAIEEIATTEEENIETSEIDSVVETDSSDGVKESIVMVTSEDSGEDAESEAASSEAESEEVSDDESTVEETVTEEISGTTESVSEEITTEESTTAAEATTLEETTEPGTEEAVGEIKANSAENVLAEIKNVEVEYVGYQKAKFTFEVECVEGGTLDGTGGVVCSNNELSITDKYINYNYIQDEEHKTIKEYYQIVKVQPGVELNYLLYVNIVNNAGGKEKVYAVDSFDLTGKSLAELDMTLEIASYVGMAKIEALIENNIYDEGFSGLVTYYRVKGQTEWIEKKGVEWREGIGNIYLYDLQESTTYETYVKITDNNGTGESIQTDIYEFITGEDRVYTQAEFPDEEFYSWLLDATNSTELTQSKLEQLYDIYIYQKSGNTHQFEKPIKSIEGIQYLSHVEGITINGQEIEDASWIEDLTNLRTVNLGSNCLTSLPDMSKMKKLTFVDFGSNYIPKDEITRDKFSESLSDVDYYYWWTKKQQLSKNANVDIIPVPVCYMIGEEAPVIFGAKNLQDNRDYTYKLTIGDNTWDVNYGDSNEFYEDYAYSTVIFNDTGLAVGTYEDIKIEIYDNFDRKIAEKTYDLELVESKSSIHFDAFISFNESIHFEATIENMETALSKAELVKNGVIYGVENDFIINYITYDDRYEEYLPSSYGIDRDATIYGGYLKFDHEVEYGEYDVLLTFEDGSEMLMEGVLAVNNKPSISVVELSYDSIYDQYGDYLYVELEGSNLDADKARIELLSDGMVVATVEEVVDFYEQFNRQYIVYKLKKGGNINWAGSHWLEWKIIDNGYQIVDNTEKHYFEYDGLYIEEYSQGMDFRMIWFDEEKTNQTAELYFNNNELDGKEIVITVKDPYGVIATASGIVENNIIKTNFYDLSGEICILDRYSSYSYYITSAGMREIYISAAIMEAPHIREGKDSSPQKTGYTLYGSEKVYKRIQFGQDTKFPVILNIYHPATNEKVTSIKITEDLLNSKNVYTLTKEDIEGVLEKQVYRTDIMSNNGMLRMDRIYSYISSGSNNATTVNPTKITLNKTTLVLGKDETATLKATISPSKATNKSVTWTSSDENVVTVDASGNVTAVAVGTAQITAKTHNGKSAICNVTVYNSEGEDITVKPGEEYTITIPDFANAKNAKFTSADTTIATVNTKGLVSGVGLGTTKVTLQSGNIKVYYKVTVTNPLQSISFEEENLTLEIGECATNSVVFTPALTDSSKAITVNVDNTSVVTAVVTGRTIRIYAIAEGTANITATVGELQTICKVDVIAKVTVPDLSENMVYAFLNGNKSLGELEEQLPEGFVFAEPTILLSKFAGISEKEFAVVYTDANGRTAESVQKIKFVSISALTMQLDKTALEVSNNDVAQVKLEAQWSGYDAPADIKDNYLQDYAYELTTNKERIVSIEGSGADYMVKGLKNGKVTLTAILREKGTSGKNGILFKTTSVINVTEETAKITLGVEGAEYNAEKDYYVVKDVANAAVVLDAVAEGYSVKWTSSDSSIVKVGKTKENKTPLTIKSNGKVKLTATANDPVKTNKSIMLYVIDIKPSIDSQVTINKALANGGTMGIYASYGYEISNYDVQIMKAENPDESDARFSIDYNEIKDIYEVCLADKENTKEGKYSVNVKVTAATETGNETFIEKVVITIVDKKVTYTVKQSKKVNLFYNDEQGNGVLSVSGKNAVVEAVVLEDCDFSYNYETGAICFIGDDYENPDKEGNLMITFAGYAPVSKVIKISTEVKKPKLKTSASSSVLYPNAGIKTAKIQISDSATGIVLQVENANMNQENLEKDAYKAYAQDGEVCYELKETVTSYPKSAKIKFNLQMDNWNDEIAVSHTIKFNSASNPAVVLSNKAITLNKNDLLAKFQSEEITVKVKNATENSVDSLFVSGADKKSVSAMNKGMDFAFDEETGKLSVWFNDSKEVKAGTYTYNLRADVADGANAKTKFKVKVVDRTPVSTVTVKTKGSIDIIERENTSVVCTPKFTNISGKVTAVKLIGENAHLFNVSLNDRGLAVITAREDAAYITKYAYKLQLVYTLESSDRSYDVTSKAFSIKLKQGKPTVTAKMDSAQLYQASDNAINVQLSAMNKKGKQLEIRDAAIVETKAIKGAFTLVYDDTSECYRLSVKDVSKVKKNKTYTIKMNVWTKTQADNEKPIVVSIKVKVK